jgi:hypothetical protein
MRGVSRLRRVVIVSALVTSTLVTTAAFAADGPSPPDWLKQVIVWISARIGGPPG